MSDLQSVFNRSRLAGSDVPRRCFEEFRCRKHFFSYLAYSAPIISTNYLIVHMNAVVHMKICSHVEALLNSFDNELI